MSEFYIEFNKDLNLVEILTLNDNAKVLKMSMEEAKKLQKELNKYFISK
jgi:hypothetical protein